MNSRRPIMSKPTGQLRSEMTETSTFREAAQAALVPVPAARQFGSDRRQTGLVADIVNSSRLTHSGPRLMANDALRKVHSPWMLPSGPDGLSFAKAGFRQLLALHITGQDLRIGSRFTGERAVAVARALAEARRTIADMPANYIRYPNSDARVFGAAVAAPPRTMRDELTLDGEVLGQFGGLTVLGQVWRTLQRLGSWVEPVLVNEWARLVRAYGERMGRMISLGEVEAALAWLDPARDTQLARLAAKRVLDQGWQLRCVWTGARLGPGLLDIDHCLPWSAWPCGDLWNLLPASPRVNQHLKRDRLPSASAGARDSIIAWWENAWLPEPTLRARFERETVAALPVTTGATTDDVFAGVEWRRLRLRQDQQVQEWAGVQRS
jgi:HNH endonuclease